MQSTHSESYSCCEITSDNDKKHDINIFKVNITLLTKNRINRIKNVQVGNRNRNPCNSSTKALLIMLRRQCLARHFSLTFVGKAKFAVQDENIFMST